MGIHDPEIAGKLEGAGQLGQRPIADIPARPRFAEPSAMQADAQYAAFRTCAASP